MTKRGLGCVVLMAASSLAGCGHPVSTFFAQQDAFVDDVCSTCPQAAGTDSEVSCRAALESDITATQQACLERVYDENSEELAPVLDCENDAVGDYRACVHTAIATCPPTPADLQLCIEQATAAAARCPTPSAATNAEYDACTD